MISKSYAFHRRKDRIRKKIKSNTDRVRLSIFKSGRHVYAQIIDDKSSATLVSASTLDQSIRVKNKSNANINFARKVGQILVKKALDKGIKKVVFDKGGYKYHGVIKALADEARNGLNF